MSVLKATQQDNILTLTLCRPDKLNALNLELLQSLHHELLQANDNPEIKAILITGEGKAFCAGADIQRLAKCDAEQGYQFARSGQAIFNLLETLSKPSLAAINGYAFGGGCELLMSATLRIASTHAQFCQPEIKLGVIPGYGGTQRLARLIGKGRALDLCLTGRVIDAATALSWGLVTDLVAPEQLIQRAHEILHQITSMAPIAIQSILEVIHAGYDLPLNEALKMEALQFARTCATADKTEGVSAFLEKRQAHFKGI